LRLDPILHPLYTLGVPKSPVYRRLRGKSSPKNGLDFGEFAAPRHVFAGAFFMGGG
jgi:hypothetical protein